MKPMEFTMDKTAYRAYLKALQRCPDTVAHGALEAQRRVFGLMLVVIAVAVSLARSAPLMQIIVTLLVDLAIWLPLGFWILPQLKLTQGMAAVTRNQGEEWFKQPHRIWTDERYYYHQIGIQSAVGVSLTQLKFARPAKGGGVVISIGDKEDYLRPDLFTPDLREVDFCAELRQLAKKARELPAENPVQEETAEEMENPFHLVFDVSAEDLVDLVCEATDLVIRTRNYWKDAWKGVIFLLIAAVLWVKMGLHLWLFIVLIVFLPRSGLLSRFSPALRRRQCRKLVKAGCFSSSLGRQELELTPEKIYIQRQTIRASYRYENFREVFVGKKGVYLVLAGNQGTLPVPMTAFRSDEQREQFVQEYIRRKQGTEAEKNKSEN